MAANDAIWAKESSNDRALRNEALTRACGHSRETIEPTGALEDPGCAAIEAADGVGGLQALRSNARIGLPITGAGLPGGLDARQSADAARLNRPDLEILLITGFAENAPVGNGQLEAGMALPSDPFAPRYAGSADPWVDHVAAPDAVRLRSRRSLFGHDLAEDRTAPSGS